MPLTVVGQELLAFPTVARRQVLVPKDYPERAVLLVLDVLDAMFASPAVLLTQQDLLLDLSGAETVIAPDCACPGAD